ncbi:MAG: hypothetical protein QXK06_01010 [Candidatus Diapherotrites archaeon]
MDKKAIGSLVLVLLIFGSLVAMGLNYLLEHKPNDGDKPPVEEPTPSSQPQIYYFAQDLDANVFELSQVYPLKGYTSETNLSNVTSELSSLESIDRIFAAEFQNPEPDRERFMPVYVEILLKPGKSIDDATSEISSKGILSDIVASRKAVVKVPSIVSLKSVQSDLNLSKTVTLEEPFVSAIVSTDAMSGDELKIVLYLAMKGEEIVGETMTAYMSDNISAKPRFRITQTSGKIARLDNFLGFEKKVSYNGFDPLELKAALEGINGVQKAEVLLESINSSFSIDANISGKDLNMLKQDLNSAFNAINGITGISFTETGTLLSITLSYNLEEGYAKIMPVAVAKAEEILASKDYSLKHPTADLNCILFLSGNPAEIARSAESVFSSFGVDGNFWQQAFFEIKTLTDKSTGEEFAFPQGISELPVRVKPGSEINTDLNLQIIFQTTRKNIDAAYATAISQ